MAERVGSTIQELKDFWRIYKRNRSGVISLGVIVFFTLVAVLAPVISPYSLNYTQARAWQPPSAAHLMGTDPLGRDVFTLVIWGAQNTMEIGIFAALISIAVGVLVGAVSGYRGTIVDNILMRFTDTMLVMPTFFLALLVAFIFGGNFTNLVLIIGLTSWPTTARVVRAQVLTVKKLDYVEGARAIGATDTRILARYIIPNSLSVVIVAGALSTAAAMLTESYISFLGAGDPSRITWGYLLYYALVNINAWWVVAFPGLALAAAVISFNLVAQSLNDSLNLQTRGL